MSLDYISLPSREYLNEIFSYNPVNGELRWRKKISDPVIIGSLVAPKTRRPRINGINYHVSRIIWKMMTGEEPVQVDHIDLNRKNNSWSNLRNATHSQNKMNQRALRTNKLGVKGVMMTINGTYRAQLIAHGTKVLDEYFPTLEAAQAAYAGASRIYHRNFGRLA